jgi:hypothetical protein
METQRIFFLSALLIPTAWAMACGGSDQPAATTSGTGGGASGTGGSASGSGGSASGSGGSASGSGGAAGSTGGRAGLPPSETIDPDPTCPALNLQVPDAGPTLPDGGSVMIPPGLFGDGGLSFAGCCDQSGFCGFTVRFTQFNFVQCVTPSDARMFGMGMGVNFDAGPPKPCTYAP